MNEDILIQCGFEKEVKLVRNGICPFCKEKVEKLSFRDKLSLKEYFISHTSLDEKCIFVFFSSLVFHVN
jgi:hypothetical protein